MKRKRRPAPPRQISITAATFKRLKQHIETTMPKHERHGAMGRIIERLLDEAEKL